MLGYCTNVHRGETFQSVISNLNTYSCAVAKKLEQQIGVGLWLSDTASREADACELKETLQKCNLVVFTMNGFPFSNFHDEIVQHRVYEPNWCEQERLDYTLRLASLLASITDNLEAGISTLPLGWGNSAFANEDAAVMLATCVDNLEDIEQQTSKCIHLDIEAEPGCRLQRSSDICDFINLHFGDDERIRRYIRVCHDTCHAAIMRETAQECVDNYQNAGLSIGKVQLSSAIKVNFSTEQQGIMDELQLISEPRYLHQTTISDGKDVTFFEDLSDIQTHEPTGEWIIHFHVPIHKLHIGLLATTQEDLRESISVLVDIGVSSWEIETYTWDVTPTSLKDGDLVDSISRELKWASKQISK